MGDNLGSSSEIDFGKGEVSISNVSPISEVSLDFFDIGLSNTVECCGESKWRTVRDTDTSRR